VLPAENTTWEAWRKAYPNTLVLSFKTGFAREYHQDPYADYPMSRSPALLVSVGGTPKIYPFSELKKSASPLVDQVGGHGVKVQFDRRSQTARVESHESVPAVSFVSFLDDLKAFYPNSEIYQARRH